MIGGINIGTETITVATPAGTSRHRNAIQSLGEPGSDDDMFVYQSENSSYAVGNAVENAVDTGIQPLFGDAEESTGARDCRGKFLAEIMSGEAGAAPGSEGRIGVVDRDTDVRAQLTRAATQLDNAVEPIDPGMAVCYDVLGEEPTAIGIALFRQSAFATLAVAGVPVATARVEHDQRWYSLDGDTDLGEKTPKSEWTTIRYETLLADLAAEMATVAPSVGDEIAVAIGGPVAPSGATDGVATVLGDEIQREIASVTVAETPAESPARGALAAVQNESERGPVPAFATTDSYVPALADTSAIPAALVGDREQSAMPAGDADASEATEPEAKQYRLQRAQDHQTKLATAVGRLVEFVDDEKLRKKLEDIESELQAAISELETELEAIEAQAPPAEAVSDLEATVNRLEATLSETEDDVQTIQSMLAGLDESEGMAGVETTEAMESVATDALQDNIEDVRDDLSGRIEGIWDQVDELNNELVDVTAQVEDLPDLESDLRSTTDSIDDLTDDFDGLRNALAGLREDVEALEEKSVTGQQLQSVRTRLDSVASDLGELETSFRELDRADPARVDELHRDLDALQETVVDHARRLEGVERTTSDLDDRITQAFQDTAKAEALSSLQAEVSRIRESATDASETATDAAASADDLDGAVQSLQNDIGQVRTTVDGLAESSVTRSELQSIESQVQDIESRFENLQAQQEAIRDQLSQQGGTLDPTPLYLAAAGLASAGGLAAFYALDAEQPAFAAGFAVLVVGPALWLWFRASNM